MNVQLANKPNLVKNILFLSGMGRAGKFLLGKIVSNFQRVEYFKFVSLIEQLPQLHDLKCMDRKSTITFLQLNVDLHIYEMAIGRNLNTRSGDSSSILNAPDFEIYKKRSKKTDGMKAVEEFNNSDRLPVFLVHEALKYIDLYLDAFPKLSMIEIQRHPIDIVHSWHVRGWGNRQDDKDPLAFSLLIKGPNSAVPIYAAGWEVEYEGMVPVDRVVKSVLSLIKSSQSAYSNLEGKKEQILFVTYENIFSTPNQVVQQISQFLDTEPSPNIIEFLRSEGVPKEIALKDRQNKFQELKALSGSKDLIDEIVALSLEYEKRWNLGSFL